MLKKIGVILTLIVFLCAGTALAAPKTGGTLIFGRGGDSVGGVVVLFSSPDVPVTPQPSSETVSDLEFPQQRK